MAPHSERWEGELEARMAGVEKKLDDLLERCWGSNCVARIEATEKQIESLHTKAHSMSNRLFALELALERNKGRIEGGKMVAVLVGSGIGSALGALVTWIVGRP